MPPRFHKFKLLLDEGLPPRNKFPRVNSRFDLKHIREDYKLIGLPDTAVYEKGKSLKRLIIVLNVKDFKELAGKSKHSGIIGVSPNLTFGQIDTKLNALLSKSKSGDLFGKFTYISGEVEE